MKCMRVIWGVGDVTLLLIQQAEGRFFILRPMSVLVNLNYVQSKNESEIEAIYHMLGNATLEYGRNIS